MNTQLACFELVELRLLQQKRGSCTDGLSFLRLAIGIIVTVVIMFGVMAILPQEGCLPLVIPGTIILAGLVFTVAWIIRSDEKTTQVRISELERGA